MKLLACKTYDPDVAVVKNTTALIAMTALDTTNLRCAFTIPAHGMIRVHLAGVLHGATTVPQIMLGVLEGVTVRGRQRPMLGGGNVAATTGLLAESWYTLTGLTPGVVNWDAAYGVETVVAATGLKYGGPNNATANDAFGAFVFEVWDPAPASAGGAGATAQEVWEYATRALTDKAGFGVTSLGAGTVTAASIAAAALNGKGDWNVGKTGYSLTQAFPTNFAALAITAPGAVTAGTVGDKTGYTLATAPPTVAQIRAEMDASSTKLANLDAAVSTRMATFTYAAPDNAGITAIKAQTDKLVWTSMDCLKVDTFCINGVRVYGGGTDASKWRGVA